MQHVEGPNKAVASHASIGLRALKLLTPLKQRKAFDFAFHHIKIDLGGRYFQIELGLALRENLNFRLARGPFNKLYINC